MNDDDAYIHGLIQKVLFSAPRERPNQPDFGGKFNEFAFMPNTPELRAALESLVQETLNRSLSKVIEVEDVQAIAKDSGFRVTIKYAVRSSNQYRGSVFDLNF